MCFWHLRRQKMIGGRIGSSVIPGQSWDWDCPWGKMGQGLKRVLAYVCKRISIQSGVSQTRGSRNRSVGSLLVPFPDSFVPELGAFKRTVYRLRYFEDVAG